MLPITFIVRQLPRLELVVWQLLMPRDLLVNKDVCGLVCLFRFFADTVTSATLFWEL
jgi:hypothetical protein